MVGISLKSVDHVRINSICYLVLWMFWIPQGKKENFWRNATSLSSLHSVSSNNTSGELQEIVTHFLNWLCSNLHYHFQLVSSDTNTFQTGGNNEENNPMSVEGNGPITENPPAYLPLKILGRYESHNYKSLALQRLTNVNPSVGKEWYKKKVHRTLIHTLTKAQHHNFRTHGPFDKAITTGRQGSRGWRFAIHRGQFIPCLWTPYRANNDQPPYIISRLLSSPLLHMHVFSSNLPSTGLAKNRAARWPAIRHSFTPEFTCHFAFLL